MLFFKQKIQPKKVAQEYIQSMIPFIENPENSPQN